MEQMAAEIRSQDGKVLAKGDATITIWQGSDGNMNWKGYILAAPGPKLMNDPFARRLVVLQDGRRGEIAIVKMDVPSGLPTGSIFFEGSGPLEKAATNA